MNAPRINTTHTTMDSSTMTDLFSAPGTDTRQWLSYGIVCPDTESGRSVRFKDANGAPLPQGVLVEVKLQPSGNVVPCRVGSQAAGSGEGEYSPFGPGDEVLVALPGGSERGGCVIVCRLSNGLDTFPTAVAGMDVTNNNVTFKRLRTSFILETAASYMVRSALTGASFSIDPTGNFLANDGSGNILTLSHAVLALQDSTGAAGIQVDPENLTVGIAAEGTSFLFKDAVSTFQSTGTLGIGTSGVGPLGHAVTAEQVIAWLSGLLTVIGPMLTPPIITPIPTIIDPLVLAAATAAMTATAATYPLTSAAFAGLLAGSSTPGGPFGVGRAGLTF